MPSKQETRINVTFAKHPEILKMVKRDAELEERSESAIIVRALARHYQQREQEAELFTSPRLHEAKRSDSPHFEAPEAPPPLSSERPSKYQMPSDLQKK